MARASGKEGLVVIDDQQGPFGDSTGPAVILGRYESNMALQASYARYALRFTTESLLRADFGAQSGNAGSIGGLGGGNAPLKSQTRPGYVTMAPPAGAVAFSSRRQNAPAASWR